MSTENSPEDSPENAAGQDAPAPAQESAQKPTEAVAKSAETETGAAAAAKPAAGGPLNLSRIRELRKSQHQPAAPAKPEKAAKSKSGGKGPKPKQAKQEKNAENDEKSKPAQEVGVIKTPPAVAPKVEVPSLRQPLAADLEDELNAAFGGSDLDSMLIGDEMLQVGKSIEEGQRLQAKIVKAQEEFVFVSLGGPNEGMVPSTQFETEPEIGSQVEVVVRGFNREEGLYEVTLPGNAVEVSEWDDINEGEVIEVLVTGSNTGGLECKAGAIRGFIPASQVAEYRVENLAELVDQKVLCVVTEANERRGNLVLSRRAVLEREKEAKRAERMASISVGDSVEGTVTKILDFGAFVDIGGLDGLLHISQLSWDRVNHPSEVVEVGQKVEVRIDKIDEQSGKIGLSYRSLADHPWNDIDSRFSVGSVCKGTVSRIAEFGAFVKVATGVEGLVHISELAHHRVSNVSNVVSEGEEIDVKVLSVDTANQRMSLSIKGAQAAPEPKEEDTKQEEELPPAKPVLPKHQGPLKGGTGSSSGGERFGLKW